MNLRNAAILLNILFLAALPPGSWAAVDATTWKTTVRQFLATRLPAVSAGSEREIRVSDPDPRLQLPACPQPAEAFWPANARQHGSTVVGLRCAGEDGWQVFLPVQILEWTTVVVASRPLRPGERLQAADLKLQRVARDQLQGEPYEGSDRLVGAVTRQAIAAGQPVTHRMTCQVCRGDEVRIRAGDGQFEVVVKGIAEGSGNAGDRLPVRNLSSRRTVQAVVDGAGLVRVNL